MLPVKRPREASEGSRLLDALAATLAPAPKAARSACPFFRMALYNAKILNTVAECLRDNVLGNFQFDSHGASVHSLHHLKTVFIHTTLGSALFSEFACDDKVRTSVNLSVFAKKLASMQKFKLQKLAMESDSDSLVLKGYTEHKAPIVVSMHAMEQEFETDDILHKMVDLDYPVTFRLLSTELAMHIELMPSYFTIYFDSRTDSLVFTGKEDHSATTVPMRLDREVASAIRQHPKVANFKGTFDKSHLGAVGKGVKVSEYVVIGFQGEQPLHVRYVLGDMVDGSSISMYFAPQIECND
jgi:hypothetical protein